MRETYTLSSRRVPIAADAMPSIDDPLQTCARNRVGYVDRMPLTNLSVAEEALSLSPSDRAELAKLLIQRLEGDNRTDEAIKADLASRLEQLQSGADPGLTFEEVFKSSL